ncbi:MAG: molecular chaperone Tir, partial [Pseudomonadota bacterium]
LLLGAEEGPAIDTDLIVIGRHYRREAVAAGSPLPCAVVDMVGPPLRNERRLKNARNLGLHWIDSTTDGWSGQVRSWLRGLGNGQAPAAAAHS